MYQIANWHKFQHYKDRTPPWIKLSRSLLDDYEWHCLPDASKAIAPMLWLLASEHEDPKSGLIELNNAGIAFRLRMTEKKVEESVKPLIGKFIIITEQDASKTLATTEQDATPETEAETKKETEEKAALPSWIKGGVWKEYVLMRKKIKKPATDFALQKIIKKLEEFKNAGHDPNKCLENSIINSWQDVYPPKANGNARGSGDPSPRKAGPQYADLKREVYGDDYV